MEHTVVVILAFVLDTLLGEPRRFPHPVRMIGLVIDKGEQWLRQGPSSPARDFWGGCSLVRISAYLLLCGRAPRVPTDNFLMRSRRS